ncbi:hypothetical protein TNCV_4096361 [Trichonephila clavipes]|nr:hypothetical protein TNCV_4096361 [Trichonephila clavipes]
MVQCENLKSGKKAQVSSLLLDLGSKLRGQSVRALVCFEESMMQRNNKSTMLFQKTFWNCCDFEGQPCSSPDSTKRPSRGAKESPFHIKWN